MPNKGKSDEFVLYIYNLCILTKYLSVKTIYLKKELDKSTLIQIQGQLLYVNACTFNFKCSTKRSNINKTIE